MLCICIWYINRIRIKKKENKLYKKSIKYQMSEKDGDEGLQRLVKTNFKIILNQLKFTSKISEEAGWY